MFDDNSSRILGMTSDGRFGFVLGARSEDLASVDVRARNTLAPNHP
jgi:hypothetical protein